jgi:hypothetical protein
MALNFKTHHLGSGVGVLRDIVQGKGPMAAMLAQAKVSATVSPLCRFVLFHRSFL